jgi:hypothetical protein
MAADRYHSCGSIAPKAPSVDVDVDANASEEDGSNIPMEDEVEGPEDWGPRIRRLPCNNALALVERWFGFRAEKMLPAGGSHPAAAKIAGSAAKLRADGAVEEEEEEDENVASDPKVAGCCDWAGLKGRVLELEEEWGGDKWNGLVDVVNREPFDATIVDNAELP